MVQSVGSVNTKSTQLPTWPIVGQAELGRYLLAAMAAQRLASAILFTGPRSIGKATGARWLVQYDLCTNEHRRACGRCPSCRQVAEGTHSDVQWIDPEDRQTIGIELVRQVIQGYTMAKWGKGNRWCVIIDADRLTEAASNTLLKFVEELPPQVRILATTAEPESLLPTLRSRLTMFQWSLVNPAALAEGFHLAGHSAAIDRAAGRPGWLHELQGEAATTDHEQALSIAHQLGSSVRAPSATKHTPQKSATIGQLDHEEIVIRDVLLASLNMSSRRLWPDIPASHLSPDRLLDIAGRYLDRHQFSTNVQPRILYDDLHLV